MNSALMAVLPLSVKARFQFIKENFGYEAFKRYQYYENTMIKIERLYCDRNFLIECKWNNIIPKFLHFKLPNAALLYSRTYLKCQQLLLDEEISLKKRRIKYLSAIGRNPYSFLVDFFPPIIIKRLIEIMDELRSDEQNSKFVTHRNKFRKLLELKNKKKRSNTNLAAANTTAICGLMNTDDQNKYESKIVWNLSNRMLSEDELKVLEKGLAFNRPGELNHSQVISNVEDLFHHASSVRNEVTDFKKWDEDPDNILQRAIRVLEPKQLNLAADLKSATVKFFHDSQISMRRLQNRSLACTKDNQILSNLSRDPSILITRPDKGRGVVVLDRRDYVEKLEIILSDKTKFKLLDKDPTISRENALTSLLRRMKREEYLTKQEYQNIKPVGSVSARLYGLPKVHKTNAPLRPIVSCINSYNYRLGKYLANIIKPIRDSHYSLKNTDDFLKFVKEKSHLSRNTKIISFDIESLFTNIPVDETIEIICYKLYCTDPKLRPFIPENYLLEMLKFATKFTHFLFNKKYYDQCDGVSMGTPLAAIFAEVFMAHFEETHFPSLLEENGAKLLAWRRYVDDTFTIFNSDVDPDEVRQVLNTFHRCIRFTAESEIDSTLAFLDALVKRSEHSFETTVYRKKTTTKLMLKWSSLVPTSYKRSSVASLVNRAIRVCSSYHLLHNEFQYIRTMAEFNDYPLSFVDRLTAQALQKLFESQQIQNPDPEATNEQKRFEFIEVPYLGRASYTYAKKLQSIIMRHQPMSALKVIYRTTNTTQKFFPNKDALSPLQQSGVVYQIACLDCGKTYIGKTIRQSCRRVDEHRKDVTKATIYLTNRGYHTKPTKDQNQTTKTVTKGRIQKPNSTQPLRRSSRLMQKRIQSQLAIASDNIDIPIYQPNSALGRHVRILGHSIDFKNIRILTKDSRPYRLLLKESLEIRARNPALNNADTSVPLYVFPEGNPSRPPQSSLDQPSLQ